MRWTSTVLYTVLWLAAVPYLQAQTAAPAVPPPAPPAVIVLDPAHGGDDSGGQITEQVSEKNLNVQIASKLRNLLVARGFDVRMTRSSDDGIMPNAVQRAGMANTARALACVIMHSTATGNGVHLYTSTLPVMTGSTDSTLIRWKEAQRPYVASSQHLSDEMESALTRAHLPVVKGRSWIVPLDAMQCPALVVEVGPLEQGSDQKAPTDEGYQQHVAESIAGVLLAWKNSGAAMVKP